METISGPYPGFVHRGFDFPPPMFAGTCLSNLFKYQKKSHIINYTYTYAICTYPMHAHTLPWLYRWLKNSLLGCKWAWLPAIFQIMHSTIDTAQAHICPTPRMLEQTLIALSRCGSSQRGGLIKLSWTPLRTGLHLSLHVISYRSILIWSNVWRSNTSITNYSYTIMHPSCTQ